MEADSLSNPSHQTDDGDGEGWHRQRHRNRRRRGKKNASDFKRNGAGNGSSSRKIGDRRGVGRVERNGGRPQRAIIDSDDASAASSVDSDIARDYVANLLNDKNNAEDDVHLVAALDAAASKQNSDINALVQYAQTSTPLPEVDEEEECTENMEGNGSRRRRRRRGKNGASRRDRASQSPRDQKPPISSLYGEPVGGKGKDMLQRMGWEDGAGLGANADGRTEPIKVRLQRSRRGLGT